MWAPPARSIRMGTYTGIAKLAAVVGPRRRAKPLVRAEGFDEEGTRAEHVCPTCGDTSIVPTECDRCQAPMRSRGEVVRVRRRAYVSPLSVATFVTNLGFAIAAILGEGALLSQLDAHININLHSQRLMCAHNAWVSLGALALAGVMFGLYLRFAKHAAKWLARALTRGVAPLRRAGELPDEVSNDVRVRGTVHIERGDDGKQKVFVIDGESRVRLPSAQALRVRAIDNDRDALGEGEEVEVRGVGRRERGEGSTYRDGGSGFVFSRARVMIL